MSDTLSCSRVVSVRDPAYLGVVVPIVETDQPEERVHDHETGLCFSIAARSSTSASSLRVRYG